MNTAAYVSQLVAELTPQAIPLSKKAWETALACEGWPYVFGAWGAECTPAERQKRYNAHPSNTTIKTSCKAFSGGSCDGCKWYPDRFRTRCFDCRGFTDWVIKQWGFDLQGEGATAQWNTAENWCAKGTVKEGIPEGVLVCLFYVKKDEPAKMAHTGLYYNGETCECSNNVQHFTKLNKKWTHWAVAKIFEKDMKEAGKVPEGYAKVTGKRVALRKEPSTKAKILTRIDTGNLVKLEEEPPKAWDYVEYNGQRGYMMREFLQEG